MDVSSRPISRTSSRRHSVSSELGYQNWGASKNTGTSTYYSNAGLATLLNERQGSGYKLNEPNTIATSSECNKSWKMQTRDSSPFVPSEIASSIMSLTPSVISTPAGTKSFSPTGTPLNSPLCSPPMTPPNERITSNPLDRNTYTANSSNESRPEGLVYSFFASLKNAVYGEQQKEAKTMIRKKRKKDKHRQYKRLGILEKVEEVGVENLFSNNSGGSSLSDASSNYYMSGSKTHRNLKLYTDNEQDYEDTSCCEELEEITPGSLTIRTEHSGASINPDATIGQLSAPSFSTVCRPSLNPNDFGHVPSSPEEGSYPGNKYNTVGGGLTIGGRGPGRIISPGEKRPYLREGTLGVPGHPGTGALSGSLVRPDLGYVPSSFVNEMHATTEIRNDNCAEYPFINGSDDGGFMGKLTSMFLGRKGGLY